MNHSKQFKYCILFNDKLLTLNIFKLRPIDIISNVKYFHSLWIVYPGTNHCASFTQEISKNFYLRDTLRFFLPRIYAPLQRDLMTVINAMLMYMLQNIKRCNHPPNKLQFISYLTHFVSYKHYFLHKKEMLFLKGRNNGTCCK